MVRRIYETPWADDLNGGNGSDRVFGKSGDDVIVTGPSADRVYGQAGNDTISGAGGADVVLRGEDSIDGGAGQGKLYGRSGVIS